MAKPLRTPFSPPKVGPSVLQRRLLLPLVVLLLAQAALAELTIEVHGGTSAKPTTALAIDQQGHPPTVVRDVRYETRPWLPGTRLDTMTQNYYAVRVGWFPTTSAEGRLDAGVELELLHDKAYYVRGDDPEGVVGHYELSDGVNYLLLNAAGRVPFGVSEAYPRGRTQFLVRGGVGPVVTKPATTIRGRGLGHDLHGTARGYQYSGFGLQLAGQARRFLLPWLALSAEGKYSYASPRHEIAGGHATTWLPTLHVDVGLTLAVDAW